MKTVRVRSCLFVASFARGFLPRLIAVLSLPIILSACKPASTIPANHPLLVDAKLRALEIPIARKNDLYGIVDLVNHSIQIKMRGEILREFRILDIKLHTGFGAPALVDVLASKGMVDEPKRTIINPPKNPNSEEDTEAVMIERVEDSYELEDMPAYFMAEFKNGSRILILSRSKTKLGFFKRIPDFGIRSMFFFKRLSDRQSPAATIVMEPNDVRALYWAFRINQKTLIASPA